VLQLPNNHNSPQPKRLPPGSRFAFGADKSTAAVAEPLAMKLRVSDPLRAFVFGTGVLSLKFMKEERPSF
jgi:hypothetical protein